MYGIRYTIYCIWQWCAIILGQMRGLNCVCLWRQLLLVLQPAFLQNRMPSCERGIGPIGCASTYHTQLMTIMLGTLCANGSSPVDARARMQAPSWLRQTRAKYLAEPGVLEIEYYDLRPWLRTTRPIHLTSYCIANSKTRVVKPKALDLKFS